MGIVFEGKDPESKSCSEKTREAPKLPEERPGRSSEITNSSAWRKERPDGLGGAPQLWAALAGRETLRGVLTTE